MAIVIPIILIVLGFVLLIKGADFLVDGASNIAKKFHIPEIVIGLTIVSIGTSMPELFVSITSALEGHSDISIGNVVGSNLANLLFILGVSAVIRRVRISKETRKVDIPICLFVTIVFMFLCNAGMDVSRVDAGVLLILFVMFIAYTIFTGIKGSKENFQNDSNEIEKSNTFKDIIWIVLGILGLKFGGDLSVDNAVKIAEMFNWSEKLIGVTILAIGTSLPELVTSVSAAMKGKSDIAVGNIIGSNIFNMLFIIGVSAMIHPITYNVSYNMDMAILIFATIILSIFPLIRPRNAINKENGILYVFMYALYMVITFVK